MTLHRVPRTYSVRSKQLIGAMDHDLQDADRLSPEGGLSAQNQAIYIEGIGFWRDEFRCNLGDGCEHCQK